MERKCEDCGNISQDENAVFCDRCGKVLPQAQNEKQRNVWQSGESYQPSTFVEIDKRQEKLFKIEKRKKRLFALAFVGLLLDFIFGIGCLLCLPVAICASVDAGDFYQSRKKITTWHLWAMVVGYLGTLFGLSFLILIF